MTPQTSHALRPNAAGRAAHLSVAIYVALLVLVPLIAVVHFGFSNGFGEFWRSVTSPAAAASLWLTVWTALFVGVVNLVFGTATAWVLVRYKLPGRAAISALIDLPLAVPTLVAGVMLVIFYGPTSVIGQKFETWGVDIAFATPGIVLALLFVTLPFVVRAVEPVLHELDPAEEEAAVVLGAGRVRTFFTVFFPALLPAAISGGIRSVGRAVAEFGSIVVISGNIPMRTLTSPVYVFGEIESGAPKGAAAVSIVLLAFALLLHAGAHFIEKNTGSRHAKR